MSRSSTRGRAWLRQLEPYLLLAPAVAAFVLIFFIRPYLFTAFRGVGGR